MAWKNKERQRKYQKEWYANNSDKQKRHTMEHQRKIKIWLQEYKKTIKCSRCEENTPCCIDFHHIGNDKTHEVSSMAGSGYSRKRIMEEINKCIPLCSNCHRKETFKDPVAQSG